MNICEIHSHYLGGKLRCNLEHKLFLFILSLLDIQEIHISPAVVIRIPGDCLLIAYSGANLGEKITD